MSTKKKGSDAFLMYRGRPLVRKDNIIYYGDTTEKYVVMLQVLDSRDMFDTKVATRVHVELQLTDTDLKARDRIVKKSDKNGLYSAMDIGSVWLDRALTDAK